MTADAVAGGPRHCPEKGAKDGAAGKDGGGLTSPTCQRSLRNDGIWTGRRPQHVGGQGWASSDRSQSGQACAEPSSMPRAPRSWGGAERRALTTASTRRSCGSDDAPATTTSWGRHEFGIGRFLAVANTTGRLGIQRGLRRLPALAGGVASATCPPRGRGNRPWTQLPGPSSAPRSLSSWRSPLDRLINLHLDAGTAQPAASARDQPRQDSGRADAR